MRRQYASVSRTQRDMAEAIIEWIRAHRDLINETVHGELTFSFRGRKLKPSLRIIDPDMKTD